MSPRTRKKCSCGFAEPDAGDAVHAPRCPYARAPERTSLDTLTANIAAAATRDLDTVERGILKLRSELLASTKALHLAQQKLGDVDELAREMASALLQAKHSNLPVKPWQFKNCAKRLRAILEQKAVRRV